MKYFVLAILFVACFAWYPVCHNKDFKKDLTTKFLVGDPKGRPCSAAVVQFFPLDTSSKEELTGIFYCSGYNVFSPDTEKYGDVTIYGQKDDCTPGGFIVGYGSPVVAGPKAEWTYYNTILGKRIGIPATNCSQRGIYVGFETTKPFYVTAAQPGLKRHTKSYFTTNLTWKWEDLSSNFSYLGIVADVSFLLPK